jgi:hypothetical protein
MPFMSPVRIKKPDRPSATIRVDSKDFWEEYGKACLADGVSRNQDLIEHMQRKIRAWRRQLADS